MSTTDSKEHSQQAEPHDLSDHVHLQYDGNLLTLVCGRQQLVYPAFSGRPGFFFPIPEGFYNIQVQELFCEWMRPFAPVRLALVNSGQWGKSWDTLRINLHPHPAINPKGAKGFFIFSGSEACQSCISLSSHFSDFVADLKLVADNHRLYEIPLLVAYPQETMSHNKAAETHTKEVVPLHKPKPVHTKVLPNLERLKGHIPDAVFDEIKVKGIELGLTTNLRLAHFLAQCDHESGGFKRLRESLSYSFKGLLSTFPKYFLKHAKLAKRYARKPQKIANLVYAARMGNEHPEDGYKHRGRGYIQLTGKANYTDFAKFIGDLDVIINPDLVATKYPLASAAFFFTKNKLWSLCDKGDSDTQVIAVTKRVNGGTHGLNERIKKFKHYFQLLKDSENDV